MHRERSRDAAVVMAPTGNAFIIHNQLTQICNSVQSNLIFAHVRAATDGFADGQNSHPFTYGNLVWMHNGGVAHKDKLKHFLTCARAKELITGNTDSEIAGAVFADSLQGNACSDRMYSRVEMENAMSDMVMKIHALDVENEDQFEFSSLNFAVSDGSTVVATRYRTNNLQEPPSLYYSLDANNGLWLASEPLDGEQGVQNSNARTNQHGRTKWQMLAKDQLLSYDIQSKGLSLRCLSPACNLELSYRQSKQKIQDDS